MSGQPLDALAPATPTASSGHRRARQKRRPLRSSRRGGISWDMFPFERRLRIPGPYAYIITRVAEALLGLGAQGATAGDIYAGIRSKCASRGRAFIDFPAFFRAVR